MWGRRPSLPKPGNGTILLCQNQDNLHVLCQWHSGRHGKRSGKHPGPYRSYQHRQGGSPWVLHGLIDEVKIYNRLLSTTEVATLSGWFRHRSASRRVTGAPVSTSIESNPVTVSGITYATVVSITGGEYAISTDGGTNWGSWTSSAATVSLNDQVKVRLTSGANTFTPTSATLTIGGVSANFTVTTHEAPLVGSGLVAWWKGENNPLDAVGGNHGTWSGTPAYAAGRYGQTFSFNGSSGAVSVGMLGNTALNESQTFSISSWVKINDTHAYQVIAAITWVREGALAATPLI